MYRAYTLKVTDKLLEYIANDVEYDAKACHIRYTLQKVLMLPQLAKMLSCATINAGDLDAVSIWDEWFPDTKADVFISHSSKDSEIAKIIASWLKKRFDVTSFIDSLLWGNSDALLKSLDDKYCLNPGGETYSYAKRNGSTAHVHMILSYALTRIIDKTECFIFLDTDNSTTVDKAVKGTYSPWIFNELATVDTIQKREPERTVLKEARFTHVALSADVGPKIMYPLLGKRLVKITHETLREWVFFNSLEDSRNDHPLDVLSGLVYG